jgi:Uma2 family endonuclease
MALISPSLERRVVLENVSWSTFQALMADLGPHRGRIAYDRGTLEIMSPSKKHERLKSLLGRFIEVFTEERDLEVQATGSVTLQREDLARGVEADESYYILNERLVRDREDLDLVEDPPPDLAVEVEVSRSFVNRRGICAALGVPEVWRYDGKSLQVHRLREDGRYRRAKRSSALRGFPIEEAARLLREWTSRSDTRIVREFRSFLRGPRRA